MTESKRIANQTDEEFFSVRGTGREGVIGALSKMREELMQRAAPNVRGNMDNWQQRAVAYVAENDDLLALTSSRKGLFRIYARLAQAAQLGLQPGGHFPHFHLVVMGTNVTLIPTAEGMAFAATHGPGAVLGHVPEIIEVHENDDLRIDSAGGSYTHGFDPREYRGAVVGYLTRLQYRDGHAEIPYISIDDVQRIAENYANENSPAWKKSPRDMLRKIAAKKLLRKPAAESEALAALFGNAYQEQTDGMAQTLPTKQARSPVVSKQVEDRAAGRLDAAITGFGPERTEPFDPPRASDPAPDPEPEIEPQEPAAIGEEVELF